MGMTEIPCCTWNLSNTWNDTCVTDDGIHTHTRSQQSQSDLCGAPSMILCYICDNGILQELVRISVSSEPETGQAQEKELEQ